MNNEPRWSAEELRDQLDRYEEALRAAGKTLNTINTYVQHPERFIKWLEGKYRPTKADPNWKPDSPAGGNVRPTPEAWGASRRVMGPYRPTQAVARAGAHWKPDLSASGDDRGGFVGGRTSGRSSRYDPLRWYLAERTGSVIRLEFREIERIIGEPLPPSAWKYRAWWANEKSGSHVHARSWLDAGRTVKVDLKGQTADFVASQSR